MVESLIKNCVDSRKFFERLKEFYGTYLKKYNKDYEYEIKLNFTNENDIRQINKEVSDLIEKKEEYIINRCNYESDYMVEFFCNKITQEEYSVFLYEQIPMLKNKIHSVVCEGNFSILKSREVFVYDKNEIYSIIEDRNALYMGEMRKERCKDFIFDKTNKMVFASAVTRCTANGKRQFQYEIEYYGDYNESGIVNEKKIYNELINISKILINESTIDFTNSEQTKLQFVNENGNELEKMDGILKIKQIL